MAAETDRRLDRMDVEIRRLHGRVSGVGATVTKIDKTLAVVASNTEGLPKLVDRITENEKRIAVVETKAESAEKRASAARGIAITVALAVIGWTVKMFTE